MRGLENFLNQKSFTSRYSTVRHTKNSSKGGYTFVHLFFFALGLSHTTKHRNSHTRNNSNIKPSSLLLLRRLFCCCWLARLADWLTDTKHTSHTNRRQRRRRRRRTRRRQKQKGAATTDRTGGGEKRISFSFSHTLSPLAAPTRAARHLDFWG